MTGAGQAERCYPAIETDEHGSFACMRGSPTGAYMLYAECAALLLEVEGLKAALKRIGNPDFIYSTDDDEDTQLSLRMADARAALSPASGGV